MKKEETRVEKLRRARKEYLRAKNKNIISAFLDIFFITISVLCAIFLIVYFLIKYL